MRLSVAIVTLFACLGGAACSSSGQPPFSVGRSPLPEPSTTCPFGVRGARVRMSDTEDGVVIALRAFGDVGQLRHRASDAAAMYGPGAHRGLGHDGVHGGGHRHGLGLAHLGVPVRAEAENTPDGAIITVRPQSPAELPRMRAALREREGRVRAGECP